MRRAAVLAVCAGVVAFAGCGDSGESPPDRPSPARTTSGDAGHERYEQQIANALTRTEANPQDARAWRDLVRAQIQAAGSGDRYDPGTGEYTEEGKRRLEQAASSWSRYLELDDPDRQRRAEVASRMVPVFVALDDLPQATRAQEMVAEERQSVGAYSQLAVLAYQAGQARKGDLAADKAVRLAPGNQKRALRGQLESARKQG